MKEITFKFSGQVNELLTKLMSLIAASSKSQVIRTAIYLLDVVVTAIKNGDKVIIVSKDGSHKKEIIISEINK